MSPAPTVTGRSGIGTRALRTDVQKSAGVNMGDGASTRADRVYLHRGHAKYVAGNFPLAVHGELTLRGDRDVEARPSHIHGDDVACVVSFNTRKAAAGFGRGRRPREA